MGTFLCSRSATLVYHRNDPLQKGFCSVNPSLDICSGLLSLRGFCMVLHTLSSVMYEKASCSMRSKHLFYWGVLCISCQYLGLIKARSVDENRPGPGVQCIGANMLPVSRIASSFFALWAFSTTRCVLNAAVVDSALGIVGINHKISSSDWMRSRL